MMYAGATPWHGLGTYVGEQRLTSAEDALRLAGLSWKVEKFPVMTEVKHRKTGEMLRVTSQEHFVVVRNTDLQALGVVGTQYTPVQNTEAFSMLDSIAGPSGALSYDTAGSLKGGRQVWILAKLDRLSFEAVPGDRQDQYLLLLNSHDGSGTLKLFFTTVRVVCANTRAMALSSRQGGIDLRHTSGIKNRIEDAQAALGLAVVEQAKYRELCEYLAGLSVNTAKAKTLLEELIPDPAKAKPTRARNKRDRILGLFEGEGQGSTMRGVRGTGWGFLNAVTEYTTHHASGDDEKRLTSAVFGSNKDLVERAQSLLVAA
jgi:phage/plasmid-like protein (TIGR03299 family)